MNTSYSLPGCHIGAVQRDRFDTLHMAARERQRLGHGSGCGKKEHADLQPLPRRPSDLPLQRRQVRVDFEVRRFHCINRACARSPFVGRMPEWLEPWARRTWRLASDQARVDVGVIDRAGTSCCATCACSPAARCCCAWFANCRCPCHRRRRSSAPTTGCCAETWSNAASSICCPTGQAETLTAGLRSQPMIGRSGS